MQMIHSDCQLFPMILPAILQVIEQVATLGRGQGIYQSTVMLWRGRYLLL